MLQTLLFGVIASSALVLGGILGSYWQAPMRITEVMLAFAGGSLISAPAFELFPEAVAFGGLVRSGAGWLLGEIAENILSFMPAFAGGAVLASLADTLMPEAFEHGKPLNSFATAAGFFISFVPAGTGP